MLDYAIKYATSDGWAVFPLRPRAKIPATSHGFKDATTDADKIRSWWSSEARANIGVATGERSGIVVIDLDGPQGVESWKEKVAEHGKVKTLIQRTGRKDGGFQLFFSAPEGRVKNRAAWLPGVDVRGDGGYVVVPPSIHPTGNAYRWEIVCPPAPLPPWAAEELIDRRKERPKPAARTVSDGTTPYGQRALEEEERAVASAPEGQRNHQLNRSAFSLGQLVSGGEVSEGDALRALEGAALAAGLSRHETTQTIRSGLDGGMQTPRSAPERPEARPVATAPKDKGDGSWREALHTTVSKEGVESIRPSLFNVIQFIRHHRNWKGRLAYNERSQQAMWVDSPPWGEEPGPLLDRHTMGCVDWFGRYQGMSIGDTVAFTAMQRIAEETCFDPVADYLRDLTWDGRSRVASWLHTYLGADRDPYTELVGSKWLVSAVARALEPGCKADHILILEGAQGLGKSQSLAVLGGEWYAELALDVGSKDTVLACHGPWVIEWSELAGLGRREAEAVKSFLTRPGDRVRMPYARQTVDLPRRFVVAGTTNEEAYLADSTGNRRYWPVRVTDSKIDILASDRDQIWAEAVAMYRAGESWWLIGDQEILAREEQEGRREMDGWEGAIQRLVTVGVYADVDFLTPRDVFKELEIPMSQQTTQAMRHLAKAFRALGWSQGRRRQDKSRSRGYFRPGASFEELARIVGHIRATSGPGKK